MAEDNSAGKPVIKPVPPTADGERTLIRDISFCGVPENGSNASMVDVKDGKIIRIRPMHYLWKYQKKDLNPWKMEVRGSTFEPSLKTLLPPYSIAERNPQNRGKSKYMRISWDEALNTIASEMNRIKEKYGPTSLLYQCDQHGENKVVQACHGAGRKLLPLWGGYTLQIRQPDSWEGWWWGSKHFWGCEPVGQGKQSNLLYDVAKNCELLLFWGCDQETTPWGWQGQLPSRLSYWYSELGIKQIYVCPDLNYAAAVHADRWIPVLPNTDAALYLAITYQWFKDGTYDKDYLKTHAVGVEAYEAYVMGEDAGVGGYQVRCLGPGDQSACPGMGVQTHQRGDRQRRSRNPRSVCYRTGSPAEHLPGDARTGQAGRQPGEDDRVGSVRLPRSVRSA
jgi:trimethylamine-N-oxide reductase (cytochrome c)